MNHWMETIRALEERAVELEGFARKAREAAEVLRAIAAQSGGQVQIQKSAKPATVDKRIKKPAATGSLKIRQSKLTHYKGVKLGKPRADGTPQYEVNVYVDGRVKYLGRFTIEEEAAAVAAEARGEHAEVKRLRELVKQKTADEQEQHENNSDKSPSRKAQKAKEEAGDDPLAEKGHVGNVWTCDKCGHQHLVTKCPERCEECGHGLLSRFK